MMPGMTRMNVLGQTGMIAGAPSSVQTEYAMDPRVLMSRALLAPDTRPLQGGVGEGLTRAAQQILGAVMLGGAKDEYADKAERYKGALAAALSGGTPEAMRAALQKSEFPELQMMGLQQQMASLSEQQKMANEFKLKYGGNYDPTTGTVTPLPGFGDTQAANARPKAVQDAGIDVAKALASPREVAPGGSVVQADPQALARVAMAESGGRNVPNAAGSSAFGPFQIIKSTWDQGIAQRPDLGLTPQDRMDPQKQMLFMKEVLMPEYMASGRSALGRDPTLPEIQFMHLFGSQTGRTILANAPATMPIGEAIQKAGVQPDRAEEILRLNAGLLVPGGQQATVGGVLMALDRRGQGGAGGAPAPAQGGARVVYQSQEPAPGSQEGKFAGGLGEQKAEVVKKWVADAEAARSTLGVAAAMRRQLDSGAPVGVGAPALMWLGNALDRVGLASPELQNAVAKGRAFEANSAEFVNSLLGSLGTGVSNADRDFITQMVPRVIDTPGAINEILKYLETKSQSRLRRLEEGYAAVKGGADPIEFDLQWRKANDAAPPTPAVTSAPTQGAPAQPTPSQPAGRVFDYVPGRGLVPVR